MMLKIDFNKPLHVQLGESEGERLALEQMLRKIKVALGVETVGQALDEIERLKRIEQETK